MLGRRHFSRSPYKALPFRSLSRTCRTHFFDAKRFTTASGHLDKLASSRVLSAFVPLSLASIRRSTTALASRSLLLLPAITPGGVQTQVMPVRHVSTSTSNQNAKQKENPPISASASASSSVDSDDESHGRSHSHSHSIFSVGHSHSHDDGGAHSQQEIESIMAALQGKGDRGSRITLLGLAVNVGLTGTKGVAGWYMNSAALLAEAGHSASDLLGDLVTLFSWRLSRRPPTLTYPYGFGKFETLGTTTVALILIGGSLGIGVHSITLLSHHLLETAATLPPGAAQTVLQNVTEAAQTVAAAVPGAHSHAHEHIAAEALALDPNAAWFALASVVAKEWLYRLTRKVAVQESSGVLLANAVHHRADVYTSGVALLAILGSWAFPAIPLDPIGGLLVAFLILRQGISLFWSGMGELTDRGAKPRVRQSLEKALIPLIEEQNGHGPLKGVEELRAVRTGALLSVDVKVRVLGSLTVTETSKLEERIRERMKEVRKEVGEVRVKFVPVDDDHDEKHEHEHEHEEKTEPNGRLR